MPGEPFDLEPLGRFSLRAAAGFAFGPTGGRPAPDSAEMRLAFPVDSPAGGRGGGYAGVVLRQEVEDGRVEVEVEVADGADAAAAVAQAARIVSLDHDGRGFDALGERDEVLGRLQRAHPGQRPVLFHSPYEAAAWSVISARRPAAQAAKTRRELGEELGRTFDLAGEPVVAFPRPERLLHLDPRAGLPPEKVERLRGVARAALDGDLDVGRLHELGHERAWQEVQRLRGIGPFYAGLIVLRACGFTDAMLEAPEARGLAHTGRYYGLGATPSLAEVTVLAERWRPFRTWAIVLIRLAGDRGTP